MSKVLLYGGIFGGFGFAVYSVKNHFQGTKYVIRKNLNERTFIVTGANSGIGLATAQRLAEKKARVIMACRDMDKCKAVRKDIVLETRNRHVVCRQLDLASFESIRKFAARMIKEEKRIDALINNAGVMRPPEKKVTREGIELQLGVNHFGHFLLTMLLMDKLKESAPSRIVNVSSIAHARGHIDFDDLNSEKEYNSSHAYAQSKLANVLFTKQLAKELAGTRVTSNVVHPGLVYTDIYRHSKYLQWPVSSHIARGLMRIILRFKHAGAQTVVYAAVAPEVEDVTGQYFFDCEAIKPSNEGEDKAVARRLWLTSEKWTRLPEMKKLLEEDIKALDIKEKDKLSPKTDAVAPKASF